MFLRWTSALKRARYLLIIAVLFRVQLWLFAWGQNDWHDLFKVDVLNLMGVSMLLFSPLALLPLAERARMAVLIGLGIACAAPLVSMANLSWMHPYVAAYFTPSYVTFAIFPWGAFIALGIAAGTMLKACRPEHLDRFMQWSAIIGFGMVFGGQYFSNLPYSLYPKSEFWLNSPAIVIIKFGLVLLVGWIRLPLVGAQLGHELELAAAVGHRFAAGVLGAHRSGVWAMVRDLEGEARYLAMRAGVGDDDVGDGGAGRWQVLADRGEAGRSGAKDSDDAVDRPRAGARTRTGSCAAVDWRGLSPIPG